MPIIDLFNNAPDAVASMDAAQIASNCGNGHLRTNDESKEELREYLPLVEIEDLRRYADYCLNNVFDNGPYMLQDIINEFGRRLDFEVTNGAYSGSRNPNVIGFDGIWKLPTGESIIIEVKTTDAYTINLETIDEYRLKLIERGEIRFDSTNLIVVGRNTTDSFEAQVRGSKYNWNTRIVGVDALSKMALIKVDSESPDVLNQIRNILRPAEYTRVDGIVEMVFTTSADKEEPFPDEPIGKDPPTIVDPTREAQKAKRNSIVEKLSASKDVIFVRRKITSFSDHSDETRLVVSVSKKYEDTPDKPYWFAFRRYQQEYLEEKSGGYYVLGCLDSPDFFAIPIAEMKEFAKEMRSSSDSQGVHRHHHVEIKVDESGYKLYFSPSNKEVSLAKFQMSHG